MGDIIAVLMIGAILFLAIKPIIKFKKQGGSATGCYKCSHSDDSGCSKCPSKK